MANPIRLPNRDVVSIIRDAIDPAQIEKFLFNDIGGTELINIIRNDSVSGVKENYSIISDVQQNDLLFDPSFLLLNKTKYQSEFDRYSVKLSTRIPEDDFYDSNTVVPDTNLGTNAYFDEETNNLVIEFDNMRDTEFIEIQIVSDGKIYEVRENDYK